MSTKKLTQSQYIARVKSRYGSNVEVLGQYINGRTKIDHRCTLCGRIAKGLPSIFGGSGNYRGPEMQMICCHQKPKDNSKYESELAAIGSTMEPAGKYLGRWKKMLHRCKLCGSKRTMMPKHVLRGHGCMVCAKENQRTSGKERKYVKIGKRTHALQGAEHHALQFMLESGVKASDIVSSVPDGKPTFQYVNDKQRLYLPDFLIKSSRVIVEVKSSWTAGVGRPEMWHELKCKAAAVIDAGYSFVVVISTKDGRCVVLPERWKNKSEAWLAEFLEARRLL